MNDFSIFTDELKRFVCVLEKESVGCCCHHIVVAGRSSFSIFAVIIRLNEYLPSTFRSLHFWSSKVSDWWDSSPLSVPHSKSFILAFDLVCPVQPTPIQSRPSFYRKHAVKYLFEGKLFVDQRQRESWKTINIIAEQLNGPSITSGAHKVRGHYSDGEQLTEEIVVVVRMSLFLASQKCLWVGVGIIVQVATGYLQWFFRWVIGRFTIQWPGQRGRFSCWIWCEFPESSVTMNYRLSFRGSAWSDWNANIIFITWHIIRFKGKWMDELIWSQQMHLELIRGIARAWNCSLTWNGLGPDRRFQSDTNSLPINLQSMIPWNRIRMYGMHHWKRFENGAVCCKHLPIELCAKSKFCIWYSMVSRVWNGIG